MADKVNVFHPGIPGDETVRVERAAYRAHWWPLGWRSNDDPGFIGVPSGLPVPPGRRITTAYGSAAIRDVGAFASGASRTGNVVTATVAAGHRLKVGMAVHVSGFSDATYNGGPFAITGRPSPTTVTWAQTAANDPDAGPTVDSRIVPVAPAGGISDDAWMPISQLLAQFPVPTVGFDIDWPMEVGFLAGDDLAGAEWWAGAEYDAAGASRAGNVVTVTGLPTGHGIQVGAPLHTWWPGDASYDIRTLVHVTELVGTTGLRYNQTAADDPAAGAGVVTVPCTVPGHAYSVGVFTKDSGRASGAVSALHPFWRPQAGTTARLQGYAQATLSSTVLLLGNLFEPGGHSYMTVTATG